MKNSFLTTWSWVWIITAILLVIVAALNLVNRATHKTPPTDGVTWQLRGNGVVAGSVQPNSAAARAQILPGDRLIGVSVDGKSFDEVAQPSGVQMYLEDAGEGGRLTYLFERPAYTFSNRFYQAELTDLQAAPPWSLTLWSLLFVGLVYLGIGFFVLFKQGGSAPFALNFATLCLTAFAFHALKPIGTFEDFDAAVAVLDDAAFIFFAPLFLGFCLIYPIRTRIIESGNRWRVGLLYLPAVALFVLSVVNNLVPLGLDTARLVERYDLQPWLYRLIFVHFAVTLTVGTIVLVRRFIRNKQIVIRQRLKWMVAGAVAAVMPTVVYETARLFFGVPASDWLDAAVIAALALIPLTFGHSVIRYRLMDVDIVVRRAVVYALATLTIAVLIGAATLGLVSFITGENFADLETTETTARFIIAALVMAAIVMLSAPLKTWLQERADRFFYGERYDLRNGLLDFGRTISATTALEPLLNALTSRLQQVLAVEKVAVLIEDERAVGGYRLARSIKLSETFVVPADFRQIIRANSAATGVVRVDDLDNSDTPENTFVRHELHYFVPCVARGRMVAVIGLGRTTNGSLLSSEDLDILRTVSGYIAVAIENSLLYQEQQQRAEELALLKEFNESIVESVNVALLAVDGDGRVTRCNSTAEDLFGVRRDDAIGKPVEDLFAEDFAETLALMLGKTRWHLTDTKNAYKMQAATRDDVSYLLNIAIAPLRSPTGERTGATIALEDVTARLKLEEQLQQREKLSSIGLLAAGVAHEVNTPLTGVSSYTQMLLGMIPETDPKHQLLQKVQRQTDRASNIVGNLLNFSRAGGNDEFTEININRVLEDTLQLLEVQLRRSQVELVKQYADDLPRISGSAGKLQQIFTNLILNARDAMPDGGTITLTTTSADEKVTITVADTGTGITPENLGKIFDPFFTTKEVGRGTGLGLAVSYGIVQEHTGQIAVDSLPGKGTIFRLTFPTAQPALQRLRAAGD